VGICYRVAGFEIGDSPPHAVEGHRDEWRSGGVESGGVCRNVLPEDWPVFAVVGDAPGAGLGGDQRLVAVEVVLEVLRGLNDVDAGSH